MGYSRRYGGINQSSTMNMKSDDDIRNSEDMYVKHFLNKANAKVIREWHKREVVTDIMAEWQYKLNTDTIASDYETRVIDVCTIDIEKRAMVDIGRALERQRELDYILEDERQRHAETNRKMSTFKTFLNENPAIKEQFDELMVLAKIAGLNAAPF